jgi:signal peptidase II
MRKWLALSALITLFDIISKHYIKKSWHLGEHLQVTQFFDLVRYHNPGAAFSFLADQSGWQQTMFSAFAMIASVIIVALIARNLARPRFCLALALILGGALGNLYDRLTVGYVVDFLFFHYQHWYWPAFNIADSAISVGVVLLLWDNFRQSRVQANS